MLRKTTLLAISFFMGMTSFAQTATDFTCNDCQGISHNLFSELNAGKVIVIDWVMPCGACTGPSLTTYYVVQSYATSHPNKVSMYVCDDYGDTPCPSLNSWCSGNGLTDITTFSNPDISMTDYGSTGMPKIVVIGGGNHTVFYNANNSVDATALQNAIDDALTVSGIPEFEKLGYDFSVSPNPSSGAVTLRLMLTESENVDIALYDLQGKLVKMVFSGNFVKGENRLEFNTQKFAAGTYLLKAGNGSKSNFVNLVVAK